MIATRFRRIHNFTGYNRDIHCKRVHRFPMRVDKFWPVGDNDDETPKSQQLKKRVIALSVTLVASLVVMVTTLALSRAKLPEESQF